MSVAPIDPLSPTLPGWYVDDLVHVRAAGAVLPGVRDAVRTEHFDVRHVGDRVQVDHRVPPTRVDDDLAGLLAAELFAPGWLRGQELFERIFTGVVRSSAPDPLESWLLFYRNTLTRVARSLASPRAGETSTIARYAPVYAHAESLVAPGSVLELGSCFGFLALRLAGAGHRVTASDVSAGTMRLLGTVAPLLGVAVTTRVADATRYPDADRCVDTVLAVHLLEHLDETAGTLALHEAVRLARRRVVVAVPLEDEADETWGHVRTVTLRDLEDWGRATGLPFEVHEHHGGWLVVDS